MIKFLKPGVFVMMLVNSTVCLAQMKLPRRVNSVNINFHFEYFDPKFNLQTNDRSIFIIKDSTYRILMNPYNQYETKDTTINNKVVEINQFVGKGFDYMVGNANSKFGLAFRYYTSKKSRGICALDSIINDILAMPAMFYPNENKQKQTIALKYNPSTGILVEKVVYNYKDENFPDTLYYYYKDKPLQTSFQNKSLVGMNMFLYKCEAFFGKRRRDNKETNPLLSERKWTFDITECLVPEIEKIMPLIEKFKLESFEKLK